MISRFYDGEQVLGPWGEGGYLYPAVVVEVEGERVHLAFLDGDEGDVEASRVERRVIGPGARVEVNWRGRGSYMPGVVARRLGQALEIAYDDGERSWTSLALCRVASTMLGPENSSA